MKNKVLKTLGASLMLFSGLAVSSCVTDEQMSDVTGKISTLVSENAALSTQMETMKSDYEKEVAEVKAKYDGEINGLKSSVDTMNADITSLTNTLNSKIDDIKKDYDKKIADVVTTLNGKVDQNAIDASVNALKTEMNGKIDAVKAEYTPKISALETSVSEANSKIATLEAKVDEEVAKVTAAYTDSIAAVKNEYNAKLSEIDELVSSLNTADASMAAKISEQQAKISELESIIAEMTTPTYYLVTFIPNNGEEVYSISVEKDSYLSRPDTPVKDGYVFDGWYNSYDEKWVFGAYSVHSDITLTAKWTTGGDQPGPDVPPVDDNHHLEFHLAVDATCSSTGTISYFSCTHCNKLFTDAAAKHEVSASDIVTPVRNHSYTGAWHVDSAVVAGDANVSRECDYGCGTTETKVVAGPAQCSFALPTKEDIMKYFDIDTSSAYTFDYVDGSFVSNNQGVSSSQAKITFTAKTDATLTFDYTVNSESNWDYLSSSSTAANASEYAIRTKVSGKDGENVIGSASMPLLAGEVVTLTYSKDSSGDKGTDTATLHNFGIVAAEAPEDLELTYSAVTLNTNGGTEYDPIIVVTGSAVGTLPEPTKNGTLFKGWFADEYYTTPVDASMVISNDTVIYAKMTRAVNIAVHYNNGSDDETTLVAVGDTFELPASPKKEGFIFEGWYTSLACTPDTRVAEDIVISYPMNLYANYVGLPAFAGDNYHGWEVYGYDGTGSGGRSNLTLTIDGELNFMRGGTSLDGTYDYSTYNSATGEGIMMKKDLAIPVWILEDEGIVVYNYYHSTTKPRLDNDFYIYFRTDEEISFIGQVVWGRGKARVIEVMIGETSKVVYINSIDPENVQIYANVTFTDFAGNALLRSDLYANKTYTDELKIYSATGEVVGVFGNKNGTLDVLDGLEGTYSGVEGNFVINGFGKVTMGDVVASYTPVVVDKVTQYYLIDAGTRAFRITLADGTYNIISDGTDGTYTGEYGTFVSNGNGIGTMDGVACVYTVSGENIKYTIGDVTTNITIYEDGTYGTSTIFSGHVFEGQYYNDQYWEYTGIKITFYEGASITGLILVDDFFDFTFDGEFVGDTLTLTLTENPENASNEYTGRTITATISGNTMTITVCTISNSYYSFDN